MANLLAAQSQQLECSEETGRVAYRKTMKAREESVQCWEDKKSDQIRNPLKPGGLILAYNRSLKSQWGKLFFNWWNGPYHVVCQVKGGSYVLEELDGTELARRFSVDQVKRFFPCGGKVDQK
ncbi:uncharacterized protein PGTG_09811 [Puccinia graminis f. sp. tritici CRL 75-36-700-3]|uniref:Uncharacterized protein n=1 Tax=Puccinia graminis f. sp. tritici (strain CRL 75-36-700-3 / race SCCL) TaxID=418459 RepID=E3KEZ1_PUCGT|nr:uncharacterized protein PGTG_09811 [Puccinia graminis f. sp. tritici CRL 75-36-700-3]EFP82843.2 hypothetical protein PGTG_09811 [Puccinia graminis f. sp. tritici CRL 75-36-700-3]